jgi:LacI family transcriptional regulator
MTDMPRPTKSVTKSKRVLLVVNAHRAYGRQIAEGVAAYIRQFAPWEVILFREDKQLTPSLRDEIGPFDGVIAKSRIRTMVQERYTEDFQFVSVEESSHPYQVHPDDFQIGTMAGEYLRGLSARRYAFISLGETLFCRQRLEGFRQAVGEKAEIHTEWIHSIYLSKTRLEQIAGAIPKDAAVLGLNSRFCGSLLTTLKHLNRSVPEEVAVLGVENDEILCELTSPSLSCVDHNTRRVGYEAAAMMTSLLRGQQPPQPHLRIPPKMVVERQSTQLFEVSEPSVVRALQFIRSHLAEDIHVEDVARHANQPRRTLEKAFARHLARGIGEEIALARIRVAKDLLVETNMSMPEICAHCGLQSSSNLTRVFRRVTGTTPSEYRNQHSL